MNNGKFKTGHRPHWKKRKHWNPDWLRFEYLINGRSAAEIAKECFVTPNAIYFSLSKFNIPRRSNKEVRAIKSWGLPGSQNGMYGRTGEENPNWKGGCSPERQSFYSSEEWKQACKSVWKRDRATCRRCGMIKETGGGDFHIHHVVSFSVKELRSVESNLVLLCKSCHNWVHSKENNNGEFIQQK